MECKEVEILLSQYIENELDEGQYRTISAHLKDCPECQKVKEKMEHLMSALPDLEEEVPFFLKNRLYYIPEAEEEKVEHRGVYFKWVAAAVGTVILFLNLFYFTDIFPTANKILHTVVSDIKKIAVETETLIEGIKESRALLSFADEEIKTESDRGEAVEENEKEQPKGGKNG